MIHPRPFTSQGEALHFLASTASAVPEEPGPPPAWRDPSAILAEARFRAHRSPEEATVYLALVCEGVADVLAEGDIWIADARTAARVEAEVRAVVDDYGNAILGGVNAATFEAMAAKAEAALHLVNAFAEGPDTFWEE